MQPEILKWLYGAIMDLKRCNPIIINPLDGLNKNENEQRGNSEKIVNRTPSELREIIKRTTSELRENHKLKREKLKIFTDFTTPKKRESLIRLFRMVKDVKANYADISDTG